MSDTESKPEVGYEQTDADVSTLLWWGVILVGVLILSVLGTWMTFNLLEARAKRFDAEHPSLPLAATDKQIPPEPRLQAHEPEDLQGVRQAEAEVLEGYGWVDQSRGTIRIPIERAMELVVKEGLPTRAQSRKAP